MNLNSILSVELFVATGCSHCPVVLNELSESLKQGKISDLNITNIAVNNKRANELNIRSVPWFSLSTEHSFMIFSGNHSPKEIQHWLTVSQSNNAMQEYIETSLANGELMNITQSIQLQPGVLKNVITMLADDETSMDIRIGLDALIEQYSATETLKNHTEELKTIAVSKNPRLQIDALHYIALTGDVKNRSFLQDRAKDTNTQIKEAALEALETLDDLIN